MKHLTPKEVEKINLAKLQQYLKQWGAYNKAKGGHFPDCNLDKCECNKFFLSKD